MHRLFHDAGLSCFLPYLSRADLSNFHDLCPYRVPCYLCSPVLLIFSLPLEAVEALAALVAVVASLSAVEPEPELALMEEQE